MTSVVTLDSVPNCTMTHREQDDDQVGLALAHPQVAQRSDFIHGCCQAHDALLMHVSPIVNVPQGQSELVLGLHRHDFLSPSTCRFGYCAGPKKLRECTDAIAWAPAIRAFVGASLTLFPESVIGGGVLSLTGCPSPRPYFCRLMPSWTITTSSTPNSLPSDLRLGPVHFEGQALTSFHSAIAL